VKEGIKSSEACNLSICHSYISVEFNEPKCMAEPTTNTVTAVALVFLIIREVGLVV
jgi:hypothetical protein